MLRIQILTTGEEVLTGQIVDSNAAYMSALFQEHGMQVIGRRTVGDRMEDLVSAMREMARDADVVMINGGLGPTADDLSAQAGALAAGVNLKMFPEWVAALERRFAEAQIEMPANNLKQANLPETCQVLDNPIGTACGFAMPMGKAWLIFTPGPPRELKRMMQDQVLAFIQKVYSISGRFMLRRLHVFGMHEAALDQKLSPLPFAPGVQLGFRAHFPTLEVKLHGWENDGQSVLAANLEQAEALVMKAVGPYVVAVEDGSLAQTIQELMVSAGLKLALVESCTGGLAAQTLVEIAGSSAYFERGYVTYSNQAKHELVGVDPALIKRHGAVSMEVAKAMAAGALERAPVQCAVSITGVAGPDGGTEEKPVGTVAFSLITPRQQYSQMLKLAPWGRTRIRQGSAMIALDMLRRWLTDQPVLFQYGSSKVMQSETLDRN